MPPKRVKDEPAASTVSAGVGDDEDGTADATASQPQFYDKPGQKNPMPSPVRRRAVASAAG
jgi:hypothetical protein